MCECEKHTRKLSPSIHTGLNVYTPSHLQTRRMNIFIYAHTYMCTSPSSHNQTQLQQKI